MESRATEVTRQTDELYRAIGEFAVKFEHVCDAIRRMIVFLLNSAGLSNRRVTQVLLAGLTAEPLRALVESLIAEIHRLNEREQTMLKNVLNRFQALTNERNDTLHTMWFIGWADQGSPNVSTAAGMKFHRNKRGAALKSFARKAEDFQKLTEEAEALTKIFNGLNDCFVGGFAVEKNLVVDASGKVSVPAGLS